MPPGAPNATLATFSKLVEKDINAMIKTKSNRNMWNISGEEREALNELQQNIEIGIKSADKAGGAIVIQNTKDYVAEAVRQLSDT